VAAGESYSFALAQASRTLDEKSMRAERIITTRSVHLERCVSTRSGRFACVIDRVDTLEKRFSMLLTTRVALICALV
jgi:hypothetical protein